MFGIENRRYVGNKFRLTGWIRDMIIAECPGCSSFFDVFAGTGSVSASMLDIFDVFYLNDFLFSNETIYKAFFGKGKLRRNLLDEIKDFYNSDKGNVKCFQKEYRHLNDVKTDFKGHKEFLFIARQGNNGL